MYTKNYWGRYGRSWLLVTSALVAGEHQRAWIRGFIYGNHAQEMWPPFLCFRKHTMHSYLLFWLKRDRKDLCVCDHNRHLLVCDAHYPTSILSYRNCTPCGYFYSLSFRKIAHKVLRKCFGTFSPYLGEEVTPKIPIKHNAFRSRSLPLGWREKCWEHFARLIESFCKWGTNEAKDPMSRQFL